MREVAEMAAQYYTSVAGASNHINNNIINMKVTSNLESYSFWLRNMQIAVQKDAAL